MFDVLLGVLLLFATLNYAWVLVYETRKRRSVDRWRKVTGRIRTVEAAEVEVNRKDGQPIMGFEPMVLYDYRFEGEDYVGTRVGLTPPDAYPTAEAAQAAVRQYVAGSETQVFVDPARPTHALLDPQVKQDRAMPVIGGVLLALLAASAACKAMTGVG